MLVNQDAEPSGHPLRGQVRARRFECLADNLAQQIVGEVGAANLIDDRLNAASATASGRSSHGVRSISLRRQNWS